MLDARPGVVVALRALVVAPGAARALRARAGGVVELAFGPGGYVRVGDHHVLLAPARAPLGPLSILVAGLARGHLLVGDPVGVAGDALTIGSSLRIALDGARRPAVPRAGALAPGWRAALAAAVEVVPAAPATLAAGLAALVAGDVAGGVASLAGRGDGLTPAGDDVLAGYAAWRWSRHSPVALPAERCAPLGRAYLRCAERGELPWPAERVLAAIRAGESHAARRAARGLAAWGASSGAALLWGVAAAAAGGDGAGTHAGAGHLGAVRWGVSWGLAAGAAGGDGAGAGARAGVGRVVARRAGVGDATAPGTRDA